MNILVIIISISFPLLIVTDQASNFLGSLFLLNVSRMLRIILLFFYLLLKILGYSNILKTFTSTSFFYFFH